VRYYKIKNWDKFQYRKKDYEDGRPKLPWIKLHRNILTSSEWISLKDNEKGHFLSLLLIANDHGLIENDARMCQLCARLRRKPDLVKFLKLGLIEVYGVPEENESAFSAHQSQNRIEKRREDQIREEKKELLKAQIRNLEKRIIK